jgi:hypothetical protein
MINEKKTKQTKKPTQTKQNKQKNTKKNKPRKKKHKQTKTKMINKQTNKLLISYCSTYIITEGRYTGGDDTCN